MHIGIISNHQTAYHFKFGRQQFACADRFQDTLVATSPAYAPLLKKALAINGL